MVLNQARVHDFYLDLMRRSPAAIEPYYGRRLLDLELEQPSSAGNAYPYQVTARLERLDPAGGGEIETIKARYVVGCDGARSAVRKSIGRALSGDSANHAWGVMDVLGVTDFPDVRFKSLIQSAADGSIVIIPREGGYLFRLYIEMDELAIGERVSDHKVTLDHLVEAARRILNPYKLEIKEIPWWSVYEIGQRLTDKFDDVPADELQRAPRIFIAGDACHTHSPKAGQGMNVSMQDAFNLGWKLASVLRRRCSPQLLHTYSAERQLVAKELIDFDREWAQIISSAAGANGKGGDPKDAALARRFQPVFVNEPSVEDTVSILRGLKDKYEQHHGVRITDSAIVAAATLSHRYIADRFLPDKAIDLVDEAAARLKMQIDSKPEELDNLDREVVRLKIEKEALKKETDAGSRERLKRLAKELAELEEQAAALTGKWKAERNKLSEAQKIKSELEQARNEFSNAQRRGEYQKAGELAYGRIPELEKKLKEIEAGSGGGVVGEEAVTASHVAQVVSRWTGIPVDRMLEGERDKLLQMEQKLSQRVIGQAEAVKAVATAVRRARAGLQDPNRPIGSFMFLGPTGVGKTELTKALAEFLFDDEQAMIRVDMSEYMEKHSVARLIGAPPGYVGYDEGGALTEAVRRRPYQVVLFDEIEKAHPDVFNVLLQVLDDGRLTDGQGRTVDFRNTLIVMTSNLGAEYLVAQPEGQDSGEVRDLVMAEVRSHFRPEFINRIDEIILFHQLKREHMGRIVDIQLVRLTKLLEDRKITIVLNPKAREWLAEKGYEPAYGARPLKRVIQKAVQDPLAELILSGKIKDGDRVVISDSKDGLSFNGELAEAA